MGKTATSGGVYSTMRIPFQRRFRSTIQADPSVTGQSVYVVVAVVVVVIALLLVVSHSKHFIKTKTEDVCALFVWVCVRV